MKTIKNLILALLLFAGIQGYSQILGEPVQYYDFVQVVNDSTKLYTHCPISGADKEEYIEIHNVCVEVTLTYYSMESYVIKAILEDSGFMEVYPDNYVDSYFRVRAKVIDRLSSVSVVFTSS